MLDELKKIVAFQDLRQSDAATWSAAVDYAMEVFGLTKTQGRELVYALVMRHHMCLMTKRFLTRLNATQ